ncbi:MAG: tRNA (adenosine(37)-N6)-dimethylallyltransferase MiaA, partial [Eubacterium sp.]|nr:tRNA (adenosine(37)-N6)-dimethylallyltransferase MiaA [Eubacterium sp.]
RCTREECIENIKLNTRHFAKRQLTWFRREKDVIWINKDEYKNDEEILDFIMNKIR